MRFICISDEWDRLAAKNTNTVHQNKPFWIKELIITGL